MPAPTLPKPKPAATKKAASKPTPTPLAAAGLSVAAPIRAGFGALPHPGGTTFRVWAPAATAVSVIGTFNGWDKHAHPLQAEPGGNWAADLPAAQAGDGYKFVLQTRAAS